MQIQSPIINLFFSFAVDFQRQHGFYAHIHPKSVVQKKCVLVLMYQPIATTVTCRFACAKNLLWIPQKKKYTCRSDDISFYFLDKEDTPSRVAVVQKLKNVITCNNNQLGSKMNTLACQNLFSKFL